MTCHLAIRQNQTSAQIRRSAADAPRLIADWLLTQTDRPLASRSIVDLMVAAERELGLSATVTTHTLARAAVIALDRVTCENALRAGRPMVILGGEQLAGLERALSGVRRPRITVTDVDPVAARMATVMHEAAASGGSCDAHQLAEAGFSPGEIIEHLFAAQRLADRLAGRADPEIVR